MKELSSAPSTRVLYPKALVAAGRSALGRLPGLGGAEPRLPDAELALRGIEIDRDRLAAYDRLCGFRLRDVLPPTYPHLLAFPLSMELMTRADFPFPVIGMVHVGNRIEQLRPLRAEEPLELRVRTARLRPHERGTQFDVCAEASADGEVSWLGRSTYLHVERARSSGRDGGEHRPEPPRPQAVWALPADIGRRYAEVSADRNPIHLHPLAARAFGLPGMIAHGMWIKARCLAALEGALPDRLDVAVRFKLPVRIPGRVSFASWEDAGGRSFALHDARNEKPHLEGSIRGTGRTTEEPNSI